MKALELYKQLAEIVGILLGDGSIGIYRNHQRIKITLNAKEEEEYAKHIQTLFYQIFGVVPKIKYRIHENTLDLFIFDRKVIRLFLNEVGLVLSPKWGRAIIPNWIFERHVENYVIRGYCDTDGSVVIAQNNGTLYPRIEMKICPSPMQAQFIRILHEKNFKFGVYTIGKGKVRIQLNGKKQLQQWMTLIGFSNSQKLNRAKLFV